MAVESAADRAIFVSTDDFGVTATYTPSGGAPASIPVILDQPHSIGDLGALGALQIGFTVTVRADDVASPAKGDAIAIGSRSFLVTRCEQDISGGFWTLGLDLQ